MRAPAFAELRRLYALSHLLPGIDTPAGRFIISDQIPPDEMLVLTPREAFVLKFDPTERSNNDG